MSAATARLGLTKPGGGSTGLILPPDPVDIDVLNANFDKIDGAIGAANVTSTTRPASPHDGQIIYESDTSRFRVWRQAVTAWAGMAVARGTQTVYSVGTPANLDAITDAVVGDLAWMTTPGTGITPMYWEAFSGAGAGIDWRPTSRVIADTKANLDAFITAVSAIADLVFRVGEELYVTGTKMTYRVTSTAGAYIAASGQVIIPSASGAGVSVNADGSVTWANGTAASPCILDGIFPDDFKHFSVAIYGDLVATTTLTRFLRTAAPADDATVNYSRQETNNVNNTVAGSGPSALVNTGWAMGSRRLQLFESDFYQVNEAKPTIVNERWNGSPVPLAAGVAQTTRIDQTIYHMGSTVMRGLKIVAGADFTGSLRLVVRGVD